ncbi:DNA polymerase I [Streptomyces sp. NPDC054863]
MAKTAAKTADKTPETAGGQQADASAGRPRLLLVDGHSMAYRAFFALPAENFTTASGQPTNAVYGFMSMLANTLRDEAPTHFAVAFDVSRKTWRSEEFPEYKANRSKTPDEFKGQVELIGEVLDAMRVERFAIDGFEADDVIATLATQAEAAGFDVVIMTGDRDSFQLITEHVSVLYPTKGVSEMTRFTPEKVEEKYGLTPQQYPDFAALRGDPSDNLPGIPKVGEKTAAKWINEFGSFAELVERADEVKGVAGQNFRDHLDAVKLNRKLTEMVRDVELAKGPADLERTPYDRAALAGVLDVLEIRNASLRERLLAVDPGAAQAQPEPEPQEEPVVEIDGRMLAAGELAPWLADVPAGELVAVVAGYEWALGSGDVREVALALGSGPACWFVPEDLSPDDEAAFTRWLADADRPKALHMAKRVLRVFAERGWSVAGVAMDTAVAAYLAEPGSRPFETDPLNRHRQKRAGKIRTNKDKRQLTELEVLVEDKLGRKLPRVDPDKAEAGQQSFDFEGTADREAAEKLMLEARAVLDLACWYEQELADSGALTLMRELELPVGDLLVRLERDGIAADRAGLERLAEEYGAEAEQAVADARRVAGTDFNLSSPKQLQEILFETLALPKTKKIKSGYTTDADALAWLATQTDNELPVILLRHRDRNRLKTTVDGLINTIAEDGRIHTTFNQMVAATGRLSSTDPNLQNIPVRTVDGSRIRRGFVVGEGYECLMTADYSQIELRVMAHLSQDEGLIEAFASGEDLHTTVASQVFGVERSEVDAEMRRKIKAMSYGLAYGLSAFGLSQQLNVEVSEARGLMDTFFERFGGVRDYLQVVVAQAREKEYTETMLGRRRYLPDLNSDNRQRREVAERMALNAPIQGTAADIVKVAMLRVDEALGKAGLTSRMLLQVHDEIVLEIAKGEREQVEEIVRREMAGAAELRVALDVSVGVGADWESAAH